jgi:hypothetical protein
MDLARIQAILSKRDSEGPGPKKPEPDVPVSITNAQERMGKAVAKAIQNDILNDNPYQLSEGAIKSGNDPSLTCIGKACDVYKNFGVDFSLFGGDKEGVRESRTGGKVVEYNPTFEKNYQKAGFEKLKGRPVKTEEIKEMAVNKQLKPGMLIQYYNEKGIPEHTNIVTKVYPDGTYQVYNAFKHSTSKNRGTKDPYLYVVNPDADTFKGKDFNVFVLGDKKSSELINNSVDYTKNKYGDDIPGGAEDLYRDYQMDEDIEKYIPDAKRFAEGLAENGYKEYDRRNLTRKKLIDIAYDMIEGGYRQQVEKNEKNPDRLWYNATQNTSAPEPSIIHHFKKLYEKTKGNRSKYGIDYNESMLKNLGLIK